MMKNTVIHQIFIKIAMVLVLAGLLFFIVFHLLAKKQLEKNV
jgi:hypothetical protein